MSTEHDFTQNTRTVVKWRLRSVTKLSKSISLRDSESPSLLPWIEGLNHP